MWNRLDWVKNIMQTYQAKAQYCVSAKSTILFLDLILKVQFHMLYILLNQDMYTTPKCTYTQSSTYDKCRHIDFFHV